MSNDCGGCLGLGSHKRWCPQVVSKRAATYGPISEELEQLADRIGAQHPELANQLYLVSKTMYDWVRGC